MSSRSLHRSLALALLCGPFLLGNRGCDSSEPTGETQAGGGESAGHGDDAKNEGSAEAGGGSSKLVTCDEALCEQAPGDTPRCDDGTAAVASCIKNADGTCGFRFSCGGVDGPGQTDTQGEGASCGGLLGVACSEGLYCNFGDGSCGAADATGRCDVKPQGCTKIGQPVCGCDGQTHGNPCTAASAGVSVRFFGECGAPEACDRCEGPQPGAPNVLCEDGVHVAGPACVRGPDGTCSYQFLECPTNPADGCGPAPEPEKGQCWEASDCDEGKACVGAIRCPCKVACFAPDSPGKCQ